MIVKSYILFFLVVSTGFIFPQLNPGARQISLSNSDAALSNDVFAVFNNPAGLSQLNWREAGVFYSPAPFGLKELANGYAAYHEPTEYGNFSAGIMMYGFELYRENKILIGYSSRIEQNIFIGAAIQYNSLSIKNYGSDYSISFNIGGLAYLLKDLRWGFVVHNITRATYGKEKNQIPTTFQSGFSYDADDDINLNLAFEKSVDYAASVRAGIEYNIIKYIILRTGFSTEPDRFSAGLGICYSFFELDYSVFNHSDLGFTHQAGIIIGFDGVENRSSKVKRYLGL